MNIGFSYISLYNFLNRNSPYFFETDLISLLTSVTLMRVHSDMTDGRMDDLRFYVLSNSISVISGRCLDDNERLCAMELRLRLRRFHPE